MKRLRYLDIILFSIFFIPTYGQSEPDDVKLLTNCLDDSIEIQLLQDEPFSGNISIAEHEEKDTCKKNYKDVKNPVLSVPRNPCAPNDIVDVIVVIKPYSGRTDLRKIKCDYTTKKVVANAELRIVPSSKPSLIEDTKHNLQQNVMHLWKKINDALCGCNWKSLFRIPE